MDELPPINEPGWVTVLKTFLPLQCFSNDPTSSQGA